MNDNKIYEVAYKTIKESLEWGCDKDNWGQFFNYVDGIISVSDELLREMNKTEECKNYN